MQTTNLEAAADAYAQQAVAKYVAKRGGSVPLNAAFNVYMWAFNRFVANPEIAAA